VTRPGNFARPRVVRPNGRIVARQRACQPDNLAVRLGWAAGQRRKNRWPAAEDAVG
jgi:hypothetical protein